MRGVHGRHLLLDAFQALSGHLAHLATVVAAIERQQLPDLPQGESCDLGAPDQQKPIEIFRIVVPEASRLIVGDR